MKYDLTLKFLDQNDQEALNPVTREPFTLRDALLNAFAAGVNGQGQPVQGTVKMDYYDLYLKVKKEKLEINLSAAEAALSLGAVQGAYPPVIAGQARDILNQKEKD